MFLKGYLIEGLLLNIKISAGKSQTFRNYNYILSGRLLVDDGNS